MKGIRVRGSATQNAVARLFDRDWYLAQNDDVAAAGADPLQHYTRHGWREGRKPHPLFDPEWYLHWHHDVAAAGVDPFKHYLTRGWREGRRPHALFDPSWYLEEYGEELDGETPPLEHYARIGWRKGYWPNPLFDPRWYLENNDDAASARAEPLTHYANFGWREGRPPNAIFETRWYARTAEIAADQEPLGHYLCGGWQSVSRPVRRIDIAYYRAVNTDAAGLSDVRILSHYLRVGLAEGRPARPPSVRLKAPLQQSPKRRLVIPPREDGTRDVKTWQPLVVAGFHRSGTSMTANLLHDAGLFMGDDLLGGNDSNHRGHFEDLDVINFHDRLLASAGQTWQVTSEFAPVLFETDWEWLVKFGAKRSINRAWGFKDPRVCLFLPQWARVFPHMRVLYVYRPCVDCVQSLKRRAARDIRRNHDVRNNRRFWEVPDLAVQVYLAYARMALRFLDTFAGEYRVVPLHDLLNGSDLVAELRENWGYALHDVMVADVFEQSAMSEREANEMIVDTSLLEDVAEVEGRFLAHAEKGFVSGKDAAPRLEKAA